MNEIVGAENVRRWWRYVVHRLAAYNVIWVLAGEYNMHDYGGFDLEFWKDLSRMIKAEDPGTRPRDSPHTPAWDGGADAPSGQLLKSWAVRTGWIITRARPGIPLA